MGEEHTHIRVIDLIPTMRTGFSMTGLDQSFYKFLLVGD